jgi:RNA polymerase sigma-70 factor (ECF subfamily)
MVEDLEPTDADLWEGAVAGDPAAFGRLFDRRANDIFAFCLRRTGDRRAAEDLMSATFLHAWRRRTQFEPHPDTPLPLLYGIAANLVRVHLRNEGRRHAAMARIPVAATEPDPSDGVTDRVDDARRVARALEALGTLPERDQELFVLCVWQDLSYEQAAAALGIPVGTVRSRLSRARLRLRGMVGEPPTRRGDEANAITGPTPGRQARSDG